MLRLFILLIFAFNAFAAPGDFSGTGLSNPAVIEAGDNLIWKEFQNNELVIIDSGFGVLGNHLANADYTGDGKTEPAVIDNDGKWTVKTEAGESSFQHTTENALYIAGADFDGDDRADAAISTNSCSKKRSRTEILLNPLDSTTEISFKTGKGYDFKIFADVNGDGRDDLCFATPVLINRVLQKRFKIICKDVLSGEKIAKLNIGKLFEAPLPLKIKNQPDYFVLSRVRRGSTIVKIIDSHGKKITKIKFKSKGTLLIGNYLHLDSQQIILVGETNSFIYDHKTGLISEVSFPAGIPFDDININIFNDGKCFCNSGDIIRNNGNCPIDGNNGNVDLGSVCEVFRDVIDGGYGWLHKPVSESTGSVVNLFPSGERPTACRYERADGSVFQDAFLSSYSNPDRATWRPVNGGRCATFPKPLIVSCALNGKKQCWEVEDPCQRYD